MASGNPASSGRGKPRPLFPVKPREPDEAMDSNLLKPPVAPRYRLSKVSFRMKSNHVNSNYRVGEALGVGRSNRLGKTGDGYRVYVFVYSDTRSTIITTLNRGEACHPQHQLSETNRCLIYVVAK